MSHIKINIICPNSVPSPIVPISVTANTFHLLVVQTRNCGILREFPLPHFSKPLSHQVCWFCLLDIFWISLFPSATLLVQALLLPPFLSLLTHSSHSQVTPPRNTHLIMSLRCLLMALKTRSRILYTLHKALHICPVLSPAVILLLAVELLAVLGISRPLEQL